MTRDEVLKIVADATEEVQRGWFEHGLTIMGGNLSRACSEAVLAAFAARGLIVGKRAGLTEDEDRTLARCIADADKNTLADPSFSALDDLLLIGLPKCGLALVRVVQ